MNRPKQDPKDYKVRRAPKDNNRIAEGIASKNPVLQDISGFEQRKSKKSNSVKLSNNDASSNNGFSKEMLNISKAQQNSEK